MTDLAGGTFRITSFAWWLAGPVFDKELRVASRRRRLYVLRFAYVAFLVICVLQLWFSFSRVGKTGVVQVSRLGEMGQQIVVFVIWFQFISGQILAAVLLSDAIGGEIRQRTLDPLLVTPIRCFQIVIGKLLSKMLQTMSLLAISLPMLAVVRVFGGVPWDFVVAGLCITLAAAVFTGSLSLACSVTSRRPSQAVLAAVLWYLVVWGLVPIVLSALSGPRHGVAGTVMSVLYVTNPLVILGELTRWMTSGSSGMRAVSFWPAHCLILLALAAALLAWSIHRVRRIARRMIVSRVDGGPASATADGDRTKKRGSIRPVTGSPVAWKEQSTPLFGTHLRGVLYAILFLVVLGAVLTIVLVTGGGRPPAVVFFPFIQLLLLLFVLDLAIGAAGSVTKEREARTWPILLVTPLEDREIIKGKALGVLRRNLPLLLPLPGLYLLMFLLVPPNQRDTEDMMLQIGLLIVNLGGATLGLLGLGLYFSARLKTTTPAVVATLAAFYLPKLLTCGFLSPFFTMSTGMLGIMARRTSGPTTWWTLWMGIVPAVIYSGIGLLFMRLAVGRVRRSIF